MTQITVTDRGLQGVRLHGLTDMPTLLTALADLGEDGRIALRLMAAAMADRDEAPSVPGAHDGQETSPERLLAERRIGKCLEVLEACLAPLHADLSRDEVRRLVGELGEAPHVRSAA